MRGHPRASSAPGSASPRQRARRPLHSRFFAHQIRDDRVLEEIGFYPVVPSSRRGSCITTKRFLCLRRRRGGALRMMTNHSTEPSGQSSC